MSRLEEREARRAAGKLLKRMEKNSKPGKKSTKAITLQSVLKKYNEEKSIYIFIIILFVLRIIYVRYYSSYQQ